jgi:type I restriction enzyme, S subunit
MKAKLRPYPAYKPTGCDWLGNVPIGWDVAPGLSVLRENYQKNIGLIENRVLSLSYGRIVIKSVEKLHGLVPASFETYQIVDPGSVIIRPTDLQNDWTSLRVGIARDRGIITSAYMCLRVLPPLIADYGYLLLHVYDLMKVFYGMGSGLRQNLGFGDLKRMPVLIPSLEEQTQIVDYLAVVNRQIDRLIRAKQDLIQMLNERKQAVIQRMVTRGLDPRVGVKHSGIDWLGEVPKHWRVLRIKYLLKEVDERSTTGRECLLSLRMNHGLVPHDEHFSRPGQALSLVGYKIVRPGQIVMNRLQANNGLIFDSAIFGVVSPDYAVFSPIADLDINYLSTLLRIPKMKHKFRIEAKGLGTGISGFLRLYTDRFGAVHVALPPVQEQREIMRALEELLGANRDATARIEAEVALLREYRARLITEVVIGKLDVRQVELRRLAELEEVETVSNPDGFDTEDFGDSSLLLETEELTHADD